MRNSTELLINLLNLRPAGVIDVIMTTDGHFIGRAPGALGYDSFIGKPSGAAGPGFDRSREVWKTYSDSERAAVIQRAANPVDGSPIDLALFGIEPEVTP